MPRTLACLALCTLALTLVACAPPAGGESVAPPPPPPARDGVFIHIKSGVDDAHSVLMALQMASIMSADRDVIVYCDIHGIDVVLADAPDLTYAQFPSSQAALQELLDAGVPILACPGCLEAAGKSAEDLRPGVEVASKERFFDFTKGRILTLDY